MSDVSTVEPDSQTRPASSADRVVTRRRGLPGGRAVVGAFLVAAAAVGTFGAYLSATAEPTTRYVVAARDLAIGEELTGDAVRFVAVDLPAEQADRAVSVAELEAVEDTLTALGPLQAGDLVMESQVLAEAGGDDATTISFALPADRALAGRIRKGETIDVIATFPGTGGRPYTEVVVRNAEVFAVSDSAGGLAGDGSTFLVQVRDLGEAQRLAHALHVAEVVVVRSGDAQADTPQPYQPAGR